MSLCCHTRDRKGTRHLWFIDTDPFVIVSVAILLTGVVTPRLVQHLSGTGYLSVVLLWGGLACLTISKISLYRQGIWLSFGRGLMSRGYGNLYKAAYVLMGVGVLLMFLFLSALRFTE
jgi:hypothetical protein